MGCQCIFLYIFFPGPSPTTVLASKWVKVSFYFLRMQPLCGVTSPISGVSTLSWRKKERKKRQSGDIGIANQLSLLFALSAHLYWFLQHFAHFFAQFAVKIRWNIFILQICIQIHHRHFADQYKSKRRHLYKLCAKCGDQERMRVLWHCDGVKDERNAVLRLPCIPVDYKYIHTIQKLFSEMSPDSWSLRVCILMLLIIYVYSVLHLVCKTASPFVQKEIIAFMIGRNCTLC